MTVAMSGPAGVAIRGKRDPLPVGGPSRPERAVRTRRVHDIGCASGQLAPLSSRKIDCPDIGAITIGGGDESALRPVGRKHQCVFHRWRFDNRLDVAAIWPTAEHVGLAVAIALAGERDPFSIGRKTGVIILVALRKQHPLIAAIGIGDVEGRSRRTDAVHQHHAFFATSARRRSAQRHCFIFHQRSPQVKSGASHHPILRYDIS